MDEKNHGQNPMHTLHMRTTPPACGRDIAQALHLLAYVCHCAGRDDKARIVLEGLHELAPEYAPCLGLLCVARLRAGDWKNALAAAQALQTSLPAHDAEKQRCARRLLAAALHGDGNDAAARAALEPVC